MKTALVTGANGGIGFHTALHLAKSDMQVILACRNQLRGNDAMLRILAEAPNAKLELAIVDLSSLDSVRAFAGRLSETKQRLDLLVNNAAVMAVPKRMLTKDGYEMQFATNHLAHFALTAHVMPLLLKSSEPRVVTVSSIAHRYGKINPDDLQCEKHYEGWNAYGNTKLANLLFAFELAKRAKTAGLPLLSVAAHPGVAKTKILASGPQMGSKSLRTYVSEIFAHFFAQTDAEGALPIIYASTNSEVHNAEYFGPGGFMEISGLPTKVTARPQAYDESMAKILWAKSEVLTGTNLLSEW